MSTTTAASRRSQVMVGELPPDFLAPPQSAQESADAQTAAYMQYGPAPMPGAFMPMHVRGKLNITLVEAKLNKNYGLMKMDVYCRIRLGHHVLETPTAHSAGKTPRWNRTISCYLADGIDFMYIELFDERTFTQDDRVAYAHIPIAEEILNGETTDKWYTLSGKLGDDKEGAVQIVMSFTEAGQIQQQPRPNVMLGGPGPVPMMYPPAGYMVPAPYAAGVPLQHPAPQHQIPAGPPPITDSDVAQVKEMFPNIDSEVIKSVLESNGGDKDTSISQLLQMQSDTQ